MSNALISLARRAWHPDNGLRCPDQRRCDANANAAADRIPGETAGHRLTWPPQSEEALIGEAHLICYDLTWGWAPQTIADDIHDHLNKRGVTLLDVGTMVDAAHSVYCPGNDCDAPTLCT